MRPKSLLLLALALGCGLIASIGISQVLDSNGKGTAAVETVPIYVALKNINLGDPIDDTLVSLQEWPKDKVPVGSISKWEDIEERRPRTVIFEGEPLLEGKLLVKGQTHDPIAGIPEGMRLKTVSVDARKSAAGLLSPGDRVDVQLYVQRNEALGLAYPFTKIILQNVRVYAVDQAVQRSANGVESRTVAKTVSLVVTPQQANRITTAENLGDISLIPRHPDDDTIVDDWEQSAQDIFLGSDSNNRSREQGFSEQSEDDFLPGGLPANTSPAVPETFQMKIIFPDDVQEIEFSMETGEILKSGTQTTVGLPPGVGSRPTAPSATDQPEPEPEDDDFPIDLNFN